MRGSLRLLVPLLCALVALSASFAFYQVSMERTSLRNEFERRVSTLAAGLVETAQPLLAKGAVADLRRVVQRNSNQERILGMAIYDDEGRRIAATELEKLTQPFEAFALVRQHPQGVGEIVRAGDKPLYWFAIPVYEDQRLLGVVAVVCDASEIEAQSARILRDTVLHTTAQTLVLILAVLLVRSNLAGQIQNTATWIRSVRTGMRTLPPQLHHKVFRPLTREVADLARSLDAARAQAEQEARLRDANESRWTPERLRVSVQAKLQGNPLFVVANREPYMHVLGESGVSVLVPASGLVTAMEPVLLACEGTWIAHGSGNADKTVTDEHDRVRVPPEQPKYTLRRVWLTKDEEKGYYQGLANEGLWPLCHIAHTRPTFRPEDWRQYQVVNRKFADAVVEEMKTAEQPVVLVQDYHFALLPQLLKERRPDARVAIFWHIPWPNPEAFGICPWQVELLDGLLGADLIGFHTQFHCNNFLETVERCLESRVEWERFAVSRNGHTTTVLPFPISVAGTDGAAEEEGDEREQEEPSPANPLVARSALRRRLGLDALVVGVGVDRVDYTKGLIERFRGIERFLERFDAFLEQFTFVQIAAPSRTDIDRYAEFLRSVEAEADRINRRFQTHEWKPILLQVRHHSHEEISRYYQAADFCLVTSLHDGMNLVAKEFVASRSDEDGVLILSTFAGASRELSDAIIVNPYDIDALADSIHLAIDMGRRERSSRMRRMRQIVGEHNVYRWAGNLIAELCRIRVEKTGKAVVR
jgi:trehalose-6-phosphate synthase